jgi:hypothetical protein
LADKGGFEQPYVFRAAVGGFLGPSFSVEWQGEELVYESWDRGSQTGWIKARPTPTRWRRFWDKCDELNVWDCDPEYEPEFLVTDGTSWEIDINCARGKVRSVGSNAYPPESQEAETKEFRAFCRAVSSLVGGTPFH